MGEPCQGYRAGAGPTRRRDRPNSRQARNRSGARGSQRSRRAWYHGATRIGRVAWGGKVACERDCKRPSPQAILLRHEIVGRTAHRYTLETARCASALPPLVARIVKSCLRKCRGDPCGRPAAGRHGTENRATTRVAPTAPLQALIEPLVVQRPAHGSELLAEFLGGGGGDVGVVRGAVLPGFVSPEVVRPVVLLPRLEALRIRFLAGVLGELLEHSNAIVFAGRDNVHVGDGIDRALARRRRRRRDSDAIARPLVIKACLQRLALVF